MWSQWQQTTPASAAAATAGGASTPEQSTPSSLPAHPPPASSQAQGTANAAGAGGNPQGQELSDMLQMLDQGGGASFEELTMFNTFNE